MGMFLVKLKRCEGLTNFEIQLVRDLAHVFCQFKGLTLREQKP